MSNMTFMEETALSAKPIWEKCIQLDFIKEMGNGTLSEEKFLKYLIQDSLYLRDYIKAHGMAIFKSRNLKEIQLFSSVLDYVKDSENATRLKYLEDNNLTDEDIEGFEKSSVCKAYSDYLLDCAVNRDIPEILMAFMPCMLGYYEVFQLILKKYPEITSSYYKDFVTDYTSEEYKKRCDQWVIFVNEVCEPLGEERKNKLKDIYIESSLHEFDFWKI